MSRLFTREDGYTPEALLHSANDHLVSSVHLFAHGPQCFDSAGYLAHLGIEITLKALLLHHRGRFPDEHDLENLFALVQTAQPGFALPIAELRTLRRLRAFQQLRYPHPTAMPPIGSEDDEAIRHLFGAIRSQLPASLNEAIDGIDHTRKSGRILLQRPAPEKPGV